MSPRDRNAQGIITSAFRSRSDTSSQGLWSIHCDAKQRQVLYAARADYEGQRSLGSRPSPHPLHKPSTRRCGCAGRTTGLASSGHQAISCRPPTVGQRGHALPPNDCPGLHRATSIGGHLQYAGGRHDPPLGRGVTDDPLPLAGLLSTTKPACNLTDLLANARLNAPPVNPAPLEPNDRQNEQSDEERESQGSAQSPNDLPMNGPDTEGANAHPPKLENP